jgi:MFS family permease
LNRTVRSDARVINIVGIGIVLSLLGDSTLYTVLPDPSVAARLGLSLAWVGVLLGVNRLVRLLSNLWAGILFDRLPRRRLLIGSLIVGALCNLIYAASYGPLPFMVGRLLWGAAWSGLWVGGNTVVLDLSTQASRGRFSGRFQMWFFLGAATGAAAGGLFTDLFGFRGGMLLSAAITALAAALWAFALPETRPNRADDHGQQPSLRDLPWRGSLPAALPVAAVRFVFAGVLAATTILWLEAFIGRQLLLFRVLIPLATVTGAFSGIRMLASLIGAPLSGALSDRLGRRWPVVAGTLAAGSAGLWFMGGQALGLALGGALLAAASAGGVQALIPAIVGDRMEAARQSRALSLVFSLGDVGSALGPPAALALVDELSLSSIYRLSGGLLLAVSVFAAYQALGELKAIEDQDSAIGTSKP